MQSLQMSGRRHMSLCLTNGAVDASTFVSSGGPSDLGFAEDQSGTMFCEWGEPGNQLEQTRQGLQDGSEERKDAGPETQVSESAIARGTSHVASHGIWGHLVAF